MLLTWGPAWQSLTVEQNPSIQRVLLLGVSFKPTNPGPAQCKASLPLAISGEAGRPAGGRRRCVDFVGQRLGPCMSIRRVFKGSASCTSTANKIGEPTYEGCQGGTLPIYKTSILYQNITPASKQNTPKQQTPGNSKHPKPPIAEMLAPLFLFPLPTSAPHLSSAGRRRRVLPLGPGRAARRAAGSSPRAEPRPRIPIQPPHGAPLLIFRGTRWGPEIHFPEKESGFDSVVP